MKKLTDKQLRECAKGGHWCGIENRSAMAAELLRLRPVVRACIKWGNADADDAVAVLAAELGMSNALTKMAEKEPKP